jgi:hypothetical protein
MPCRDSSGRCTLSLEVPLFGIARLSSLSGLGDDEVVQRSVSYLVENGRDGRKRSDVRRRVREPIGEGACGLRVGRGG